MKSFLGPVSLGGVVSLVEKHPFGLAQQIKWWHEENIAETRHKLYHGEVR